LSESALRRTALGWNRDQLDLRSDETLAQILDRGDCDAWRELYRLAMDDEGLRRRLHAIVRRVPLPYPHFWLAALETLGEPVDWHAPLPADPGIA
jgi:hypothetical protein